MSEEVVQLSDAEVIVSVDDFEVLVSVDEVVVNVETSGPPGPPGPAATFLDLEFDTIGYSPGAELHNGEMTYQGRLTDTTALLLSGNDRHGNFVGPFYRYLTPWDTIAVMSLTDHRKWVRFLVMSPPQRQGAYYRVGVKVIADCGCETDLGTGLLVRIPQSGSFHLGDGDA